MKLELVGMKAAVAGLCEELSNRHDVTMHLHFEKIPETVPRETSLCLYRVLQEALQNVLKHRVSRRAPDAGDPVLGFYSPFGPLIAKPRCRPTPPTTLGASCIDPREHVHAHYGPAEHARQSIMGRPSS